jgi:hypothetical protein
MSMCPCDAGHMNTKEKFIKAVQILATDGQVHLTAIRATANSLHIL